MLIKIARFEFRYLLRNPLVWITGALTFAAIFASMNVEGFELSSEGGLLRNAAYTTLRNSVMFSVMFMFVTTSFVANAVIRDDETGFGPIIRSTSITKADYVLGRFLGAFSIAAVLMLAVPLAAWLGTLMPWANPGMLGPNRLVDHLYAYFLLALPNLFISGAIFFALATITRSMMATYLGVIGLASGFFMLQDAFEGARPPLAVELADPFASRPLSDAVRYWTIAERNVRLPDFTGALLYNRLLWIGIAVLFIAVAYAAFRVADQGMSRRERKKQKVAQRASSEIAVVIEPALLPSPRHGSTALRALLWMRTKFEIRQVVLSPAFPVLMIWGLYMTFFVLTTQRYPEGRPTYPTTLTLIPKIEDAFQIIPMIIAIYYAGELVWRERDRRIHEIVDASPMPNWAYVLPKTIALGVLFFATLLTTVIAAVVLQLSLGFTELELGKYLLWYVLPRTWDMLILAALAVFVQALSRHKTIGWGIMVLFIVWQHLNKLFSHKLLKYGELPAMPLSDLNGAGSFWKGAWTFRIYWGAFAVLLLVAAHVLWRRGTEIRLKPRLARARGRLTGAAGWVATIALLTFIASGGYAFYNTNILNEYRTQSAYEADAADFEKRYWKYHDLPQPAIADMTLNIALYPQERRAVTTGRYLLRNLTQQSIPDVHLRVLDRDLVLTSATISGAHLIVDDVKHAYRIYRLDSPMKPGDERVVTFEARRWQRGFRNGYPNTSLIENGTFMNTPEVMPVIGMSGAGVLEDRATRRKYGLPEELPSPKLEDLSTTSKPGLGGGWTKTDITVSTSADQTPIAPGSRVSDVTRNGRRTARFVSKSPILLFFSVQSARYAEKHRMHAGVDLGVYYHPAHPWNVDRMLDALEKSLDYYQANFGPYQFDYVRITEFPGYDGNFAQAFAGTVPYSETAGFISDFRAPEAIDHVTLTTAHELAHQYWAHQVTGAGTEGSTLLSEGLANYSAEMVVKKCYGEYKIRRALRFHLDRYLAGRGYGEEEPPLIRVRNQNYVDHRKSAVVMYLLQKRLGEEAVNRALRTLLSRYKFKGPPYPRSVDFITALRAEAKTPEEQALITDLFERVTLYDLRTGDPTAVRRADGKWDVTVPVEAKKSYVTGQSVESEAPLAERIEIGLFTAEPGRDAFNASDVILMERQPIHSGRQVLRFVTDRRPAFAGIDPYNFYIDRNSADNVAPVN